MAKEQKLSYASPLPLLVKHGMRQEVLPGLPAPHRVYRHSSKRLLYPTGRPYTDLREGWLNSVPKREIDFQAPGGVKGKITLLEEDDTALIQVRVPGLSRLVQREDHSHLETEKGEAGVSLDLFARGFNLTLVPDTEAMRREKRKQSQKDVPWYLRGAEAIGAGGERIENVWVTLLDNPSRKDTSAGTSRLQFRVSLVEAPDIELPVDIYNDKPNVENGDTKRIEHVLFKKFKPGETALLTGQFHVNIFPNNGNPYERRWIRCYSLTRPPTPPVSGQ